MPVAYIDLPTGLTTEAKRRLVKEVADALHEAYLIIDTRVLLSELGPEQTSTDGVLGAPVRPICTFVVPPGLPAEAKRRLVGRTSTVIAEVCGLKREMVPLPSGKAVGTRWVLMFFRDPGGNAGPSLYSVDISGRNELKVPTPGFASDPAWSPLLSSTAGQ